MLFQLGLVGAAAFLAAALLALRQAVRAGLRWARERTSELAYVPAAWLAGLAGALAGAALFGGAPLTATFWLTLGVAAAAPTPRPEHQRA